MSRPYSAALPTVSVVLRLLVLLNWLYAAGILAMLFVLPHERWIMSAFKLQPSPEAERLIMGMRVIAVIGLAATPINYVVLERLLAITED